MLQLYWWFIEIYCLRPHAAASRQVQDGQLIHESAIAWLQTESKHNSRSKPVARILHEGSWKPLNTILTQVASQKKLIENDSQSETVTAIFSALTSTNLRVTDAIGTGLTGLMNNGQ